MCTENAYRAQAALQKVLRKRPRRVRVMAQRVQTRRPQWSQRISWAGAPSWPQAGQKAPPGRVLVRM